MARARLQGRRRPSADYPTPRHEYLYSPEPVSTLELSKRWEGNRGCSEDNLAERCAREEWPRHRREFWESVRTETEESLRHRLSTEMADAIFDANRRHLKVGQVLQTCGMSAIQKGEDGKPVYVGPDGKKVELRSVNEIVRFVQTGVDIERRSLGLAEQVVKVQLARDLAQAFMGAVTKYVQDPAVLRNIGKEIDEVVSREEAEFDAGSGVDIPSGKQTKTLQ